MDAHMDNCSVNWQMEHFLGGRVTTQSRLKGLGLSRKLNKKGFQALSYKFSYLKRSLLINFNVSQKLLVILT
jgi:hypothetical protein